MVHLNPLHRILVPVSARVSNLVPVSARVSNSTEYVCVEPKLLGLVLVQHLSALVSTIVPQLLNIAALVSTIVSQLLNIAALVSTIVPQLVE